MAGVEAKIIQELDDQIKALKLSIRTREDEGQKKLDLIESEVDGVLKDVPRTGDEKLDPNQWSQKTDAEQQHLYHRLTLVREALTAAAGSEGPMDQNHIMHDAYASSKAIYLWTSLGLALTIVLLIVIAWNWDEATGHGKKSVPVTDAQKTAGNMNQKAVAKPSAAGTIGTTNTQNVEATEKTKAGGREADKTKSEALKAKAESSGAQEKKVQEEGQKSLGTEDHQGNVPKDGEKNKCGPTEGPVLIMVLLLGALGGTLHFVSSLVRFIGNRQLKRSWLPYYLAMPFTGAGLAPIVYMLLRIGLINPSGVSSDGTAISSLNLIAIYAFAALTGMFSRVATDKLAEVFGTIFRTQTISKDALGTQKPPGGTAPATGKSP